MHWILENFEILQRVQNVGRRRRETDISLTNQLADIRSTGMVNKETKKSVVDNVVVAVLLCDYSPVHV